MAKNTNFRERKYRLRPVKALEFESPIPHTTVFWNIHRAEFSCLFPSGKVDSMQFYVGEHAFHRSARCIANGPNNYFGMFLAKHEVGPAVATEFDFSSRTSLVPNFATRYKRSHDFV
ncbi:hypothetical protein ABFX02_08G144700 [Erythranthe guttata]